MGVKKTVAAGVCSAALVIASYFGLYSHESKVSPDGIYLIVDSEGCRLDPYYCQAGKLTVGVGSTTGVIKGKNYTVDEVVVRLRDDIRAAEQCLAKNVKVDLTQGEYDAYASFVFNLGCSSFRSSTLLFYLNSDRHADACSQLMRWIYVSSKGKTVQSTGLKRRRATEVKVCLKDLEPSLPPLSWQRYLGLDGMPALYAMTLPNLNEMSKTWSYVLSPQSRLVD